MFVICLGPAEPDPPFDKTALRFETGSVCGSGTFGVVTRAFLAPNNDPVAIKRVLQDPHYKVFFYPVYDFIAIQFPLIESRDSNYEVY